MAIISNKDLEQFGNIINSLINQIKKNEENLNESNKKVIITMKEYSEMATNNQQQVISGFKYLQNNFAKSSSPSTPTNFFIDFKNELTQKIDKIIEEIKTSKRPKSNNVAKCIFLIIYCIAIVTTSSLIYKFNSPVNANKFDAIKYKLFLKFAKGSTKKNYLKWDSLANTYTLPELEEKLNKTEGK